MNCVIVYDCKLIINVIQTRVLSQKISDSRLSLFCHELSQNRTPPQIHHPLRTFPTILLFLKLHHILNTVSV